MSEKGPLMHADTPGAGDDPKPSTTVVVGVIGTILTLAVVLIAQVIFYNMDRIEDQRKLYAPRPAEITDLQANQLGQISEYRIIDKETGRVAVPIDRAIELYAAEMESGESLSTIDADG
jgi:hypothetical protein